VGGVCQFLYWQKGFGIPSSAAFGRIGDAYVAEDCSFGIPASSFPRSGASSISRRIRLHPARAVFASVVIMRTKIISEPALDLIKRNAFLYTALRKARMQAGSLISPRSIAGIQGRVHFNDFMLDGFDQDGVNGYLSGAQSGLRLIEEGLSLGGRSFLELRSALDFGCGYGRVVRLLVGRMEASRVFVTDVIRDAVTFCSSEFGVNPIYPRRDGRVPVLPPVDLIYAISVLTHLPEDRGELVLQACSRAVEPSGILLFTTHNPQSAELPSRYGILDSRGDELRNRLEADGFAYAPYAHYLGNDYGVAWHAPTYVARLAEKFLADFQQLRYVPQGHNGHQDVYLYQRTS
jgi:SAM-dependent methyltransferase